MFQRTLFSLASKQSKPRCPCLRGLSSSVGGSSTKVTQNTVAVPTGVDTAFSVPLTLVDVHLRDEQLPFAYFFHETLDAGKLKSSLGRVLRRFPVLGGAVNLERGVIECNPCDTVSLKFCQSELTMKEWLAESPTQRLTPGRPTQVLSPLFDCLHDVEENRNALASIRVTHFLGGGTALGVNLSHGLADAASCFRFVQCWGREMQGLAYPIASNQRSLATCSGMLSPELLDVLDLNGRGPRYQQHQLQDHWSLSSWFLPLIDIDSDEADNDASGNCNGDAHEYVSLSFSPKLLKAMKAHGMSRCHGTETEFVSTNDVLTAFGWLMKRQLSGQADSNMSIVINLRGRSDVEDFCHIDDAEGTKGVFGNGIASVIATLPPADDSAVKLDDLSTAAIAVRLALAEALLDIPDRLLLSRFGRAASSPSSSFGCFAVTSWQHFPLYDISFSDEPGGGLAAFSGYPSHPLPEGNDTYNSIIVPEKCGSRTYQLLAPLNKVEEAKSFHEEMCLLYSTWYDNHTGRQVTKL